MESPRIDCLVCIVPISETNLGIDVCRACAAFFKRTMKSGRSFICRQGKGECEFRKHEKFTCRSCRFDRCIEIGMSNGIESILDRVKKEYTQSSIDEGTTIVIFKELTNILRCVLPRFDEFQLPLKESLCKNLIGKFNALEYYYRSQGRFKKMDGVCLCSLITVFDIEVLHEWVDVDGVTRKGDFEESMRAFANEYMEIFDRILRVDEISEKEFHAMIAILVCQLDTTISLPDTIQLEFDEVRSKVFTDLQSHYRDEMRLIEYSSRLGKVMSLSVAFSELHRNSEDQLRLYSTLFDIRSQDQLLSMALSEP